MTLVGIRSLLNASLNQARSRRIPIETQSMLANARAELSRFVFDEFHRTNSISLFTPFLVIYYHEQGHPTV